MDSITMLTTAAVPCTCGELFQGTLDGEPCLVSCPIDIYSVGSLAAGGAAAPARALNPKTRQALRWVAGRAGGQNIDVSIDNPLPVGRGYGTSTADIGAVLFAAGQALGLHLTAFEAAQAAVGIEPTDSTFFGGLTLFDHRAGRFYQRLGDAPPARLVILDPGGMVDSGKFNARDWQPALAKMAVEHRAVFRLLQQGIAASDLPAIGEAATLSAKYHQAILFNPLVDMAISLSKQLGAAGVCRAHSGTIAGLLFPEEHDHAAAVGYISRRIPHSIRLRCASLTGGGPAPHLPVEDGEP